MTNEHPEKEVGGVLGSLDAIILELITLYDLNELEATFMAVILNIEGFTACLSEVWQEQGERDEITIGVGVLQGMLDTVGWNTLKAYKLISKAEELMGK